MRTGEHDPRKEERRALTRVALPEGLDPRLLDPEVRQQLRSLSKDTADLVARHLIMTGQLLDEDPAGALVHARAAGALSGRIGAVREAVGLAAYAAGEWATALSELRTARRITGQPDHLHVLADSERALGRPERALAYADDPDVARMPSAARAELIIVLAGARRDLGQADAAVLMLQGPAEQAKAVREWTARLRYAYADALLGAGRQDDAREWFLRAADADVHAETDAAERVMELDGMVLQDLQFSEDDDEPVDEVAQDAGGASRQGAVADGVQAGGDPAGQADAYAGRAHPVRAEPALPDPDPGRSGAGGSEPDASAAPFLSPAVPVSVAPADDPVPVVPVAFVAPAAPKPDQPEAAEELRLFD